MRHSTLLRPTPVFLTILSLALCMACSKKDDEPGDGETLATGDYRTSSAAVYEFVW